MQQNPERTKGSADETAFKGFWAGIVLTVVPIGELDRGGSSRLQDCMLREVLKRLEGTREYKQSSNTWRTLSKFVKRQASLLHLNFLCAVAEEQPNIGVETGHVAGINERADTTTSAHCQ